MIAQSTASTSTAASPRSRRVVRPVSSNFPLDAEDAVPPSPPSPASPPLPPRSPLRPRVHPTSPAARSSIASLEASTVHDPHSMTMLAHSTGFNTISALADVSGRQRPKTPEKPLPLPPPSPLAEDVDQDETSSSAPSSLHLSASGSCTVSKRTHAMLELLTSERSYASDLALIRDIHIPLALGQTSSFQATPSTPTFPSTSSASSSRTHSTASDPSSIGSAPAPMTVDDVKIIFSNVSELADFSDKFTERLEEALGSVLEGGVGEDHVGALFLETIPKLEPLYSTYITKHSTALEHLNNLPQSPSLLEYLSHTRTLAERLSHAWDLPSLLIKPVQRLLKYSLLLGAIIDETPDSHGDKTNLKQAREKMEVVAHGVNEGRRRREVVREVLTGVPAKRAGEQLKAKRKGLNINVAASVSLGRMKSIKAASFKIKEGAEANQEAEQVARMGEELRATEAFIRSFMKGVTEWTHLTTQMTQALLDWAVRFGKVIGVSDTNSEAFDAFVTVIDTGLLPVCRDLDKAIKHDLLPPLQRLTDSASNPERLLEAMRTLEPLHYGLLNFNVSKSRPPAQLLDASKSYVALRAQLHAELPKYIELLRRGIECGLGHWQGMQVRFWKAIRDKWGELWDALRVDGEMKGPASETLRVWWERFGELEDRSKSLNIIRPVPKDKVKDKDRDKERIRMRPRGKSFTDSVHSEFTTSTLAASSLGTVDSWAMSSASSQTLVPSPTSAKSRNFDRRPSEESLHSKKSGKHTKTHKYSNSSASYQQFLEETAPLPKQPASRVHSMPISSPMPLRKSTSHGKLLDTTGESNGSRYQTRAEPAYDETPPGYYGEEEDDDRARGRSSRKPSFKRRLTETLLPTSSSTSRHRRSPSLPSMSSLNLTSPQPSPNPTKTAFDVEPTPPLSHIQGMYACHVVHKCHPPDGVSYRGLRFHTLHRGEVFEILEECGHPSDHPGLPLKVDGGEDCLLLARDEHGDIGWALASFLLPVD